MVVWMMVMLRSWTRAVMGWPLWARPRPMWKSCPRWRRVILPLLTLGSVVVVQLLELVQEGVEVGDRGWLVRLSFEPFLECLLEALDLALGLGVVAAAVLLGDAQGGEFVFEGVASSSDFPGGVADGVHHAVIGQ